MSSCSVDPTVLDWIKSLVFELCNNVLLSKKGERVGKPCLLRFQCSLVDNA